MSKSNPYSLAEGKGTGVRRSVSLKEKNGELVTTSGLKTTLSDGEVLFAVFVCYIIRFVEHIPLKL